MTIRRRDFLKGIVAGTILASTGKPVPAAAERDDRMPAAAVGILYDATLCIGCQACMVACKKANDMEYEHSGPDEIWDNPRDLSSKTLNVIKKFQHGDGLTKDSDPGYAFVKRHCMHCVDPSCVSACPVSAMTKSPVNGVVNYNKKACIGCRYCQIACPFNIPKFEWDSPFPTIVKCQLCSHLLAKGGISACCSACPTGASLFGPVQELMVEAKRRLGMKPGVYYDFPVSNIAGGAGTGSFQSHKAATYVPELYGEDEVGGTQVLMLSGVPFDKLGLPELPDRSYAALSDGIQYAIYKGMVYPIVVLAGLIYMARKQDEPKK
ncbi:MAG: hydrogenase 2 operon protein HybA [Proteobacteria bacterium]|nr:hydrogenase 2 operon protein HybA [Pseudomonadota bacterium]MBU1717036.1 hydrogenase 2 operon protein HybA [Pseudomonadota bacterium]